MDISFSEIDLFLSENYSDCLDIPVCELVKPYKTRWSVSFPLHGSRAYEMKTNGGPVSVILNRFRHNLVLIEIVSIFENDSISTEDILKSEKDVFKLGYTAKIKGLSALTEIETFQGVRRITRQEHELTVKKFIKHLYIDADDKFSFIKKNLSERANFEIP